MPSCKHSPRPEQPLTQHLSEQSAPQKPSAHRQVPLKHTPAPEQSPAHVLREQSKYVKPGKHSHWPLRHVPWAEQPLGQVTAQEHNERRAIGQDSEGQHLRGAVGTLTGRCRCAEREEYADKHHERDLLHVPLQLRGSAEQVGPETAAKHGEVKKAVWIRLCSVPGEKKKGSRPLLIKRPGSLASALVGCSHGRPRWQILSTVS